MIHRWTWLLLCVFGLALGACASSAAPADGSGGASGMAGAGGAGVEPRLVVTADWLNQSLTLLDYAKLVDGESDGPSSVLRTIDLVENFPLTADSAGDFAFVAHIVDQKLSIIDLETGASRAVTWFAGPGPSYVAVQP